jgi:uncharacterized protein
VNVLRIRRYPVKSMLGEDIPYAETGYDGIDGDRRLALIATATGKIASAKTPRLWRDLLTFTAEGDTIAFPDGTTASTTDPGIDARLSAALGQPVTLTSIVPAGATLDRSRPEQVLRDGLTAITESDVVTLPGKGFRDFAPLHLITTSTLASIANAEPERYRPNIVIATHGQGFTENDWLGKEVHVGADLVLEVIARAPRCAVPTLQHGALPRNVAALKIPAERNRRSPMDGVAAEPCAGVYARVLRPGRIRLGDEVHLGPGTIPA